MLSSIISQDVFQLRKPPIQILMGREKIAEKAEIMVPKNSYRGMKNSQS